MPENLETVLSKKFNFGVEVLELARYESDKGEHVYHFEPFLEEVVGGSSVPRESTAPALSPDEIDTIVVPARVEGFQEWLSWAAPLVQSTNSRVRAIPNKIHRRLSGCACSSGYPLCPSEVDRAHGRIQASSCSTLPNPRNR